MTATGQLQLIYPLASAARYARTCCARGCPTRSRERIARIEGTRPAAMSAANTPAACTRSRSVPDTAPGTRSAPETLPSGGRAPRMIVMNSSDDPARATAGHAATAAPARPWPRSARPPSAAPGGLSSPTRRAPAPAHGVLAGRDRGDRRHAGHRPRGRPPDNLPAGHRAPPAASKNNSEARTHWHFGALGPRTHRDHRLTCGYVIGQHFATVR